MAIRLGAALFCLALASVGMGRQKQTPTNQTKGTHQVAGAYVTFGETYTLKNGINFSILKAAYSMEPFPSYSGLQNTPKEKLVVLDVAVKNYRTSDLDFGGAGGDFITLYDSTGAKYNGEAQLKSHGDKSTYLTLKPGQGVGQPALKDPYRVAFVVPLDAEITKIMINQPRLGKSEQVLRYVIAGAEGEADPANVVAPLPPDVRDPSNKAGAVALKVGNAKIGGTYPAGGYTYQIQKVESVTTPLSEKYTPVEGKRYVMVTLKIQNVDLKEGSYFYGLPRDATVKDADGDAYPLFEALKASAAEPPSSGPVAAGDAKTIRLLFEVPTSAKLDCLTLAGSYYPWKLDLTGQ